MKKCLTVLLVIAVMFTFSFGSAFAATTGEIQTAETFANAQVAAAESTARLTYADDYSQTAIDYAAEQIQTVLPSIISGVITAIENAGEDMANDGMSSFEEEFERWTGINEPDTSNPSYIGTGNLAFAKTSYNEYFEELAESKNVEGVVADAKAVLDAIDTSIYSTKTYTVGGVDYTYKTYAEKLIDEAYEALNEITSASNITAISGSGYRGAVNGILYGYDKASPGTIYTKDTPKADLPTSDDGTKVAGVIGKLETLLTVEEQEEEDELNEANLEYAKAILSYEARIDYYASVKVAEGDNVSGHAFKDGTKVAGVAVEKLTKVTKAEADAINDAIMEKIEATLEVLNVYLDEYDGDDSYSTVVGSYDEDGSSHSGFFTNFKSEIDAAAAAIDKYAEIEELAADRKATLLFDGTKAYDDAAIDEALAKDKIDVYSHYDNLSLATEKNVEKVPMVTDPVAVAISEAADKFKDNMILSGANKTPDADKKYCKDYYVASAAYDYELIKAETIQALTDAKTIDEVNTIMADADDRLAELRAKDDDTTALKNAILKYKQALAQYANEQLRLLNSNSTTDVKTYRPASFRDNTNNGITSAYEAGKDILDAVTNEAALPAAYEEAQALFADIKTDAQLREEASKVVDLINALPASVDRNLSTEAQFMEAAEAYNAYLDLYGAEKSDITGYLVFDSKLVTLKTYQEDAVEDAIDALEDLKPITTADKAAVQEVRDMLESYLEFYGIDSALYDGSTDGKTPVVTFTVSNYDDLQDYEDDIWAAEIDDVENMIRKITTASTVAEVQAAADAYDALTGSQQRAVKAALGEAFLYKLEIIQQVKDENVKAYLQDLSIVARSVKTANGNIKVTINADVQPILDAGYTVEYKFYRSTKPRSNYGTARMIKTENVYTNTSGTKGVRYYYKAMIQVKDADGNIIATTPLSQCKYACRVK